MATCLATHPDVSPEEINEEVSNLQKDRENIITKEALIGPFTEKEIAQPLVVVTAIQADQHITPDPIEIEARLAKLHTSLEVLQNQQLEAQADLEAKQQQLLIAQKTSKDTHSTAEEALDQLSSLTIALHDSLDVFRHAEESSKVAADKLERQKAQTERARSWFKSMELQLQEITADFQATKEAAEIAEKSAAEAEHFASSNISGDAEKVIH